MTQGNDEDVLEANKAVARRATEEIWNQGNLSVADELTDSGAVNRSFGQEYSGVDTVKAIIEEFRTAFPDVRFTIDNLVAEGDHVVSFLTMTGTHQGTLRDIEPTGNSIMVKGCSHMRIRNGKIVEEENYYDEAGMLRQLGVTTDTPDLAPYPRQR